MASLSDRFMQYRSHTRSHVRKYKKSMGKWVLGTERRNDFFSLVYIIAISLNYRVGQTQLGSFWSLITNQSNNTRENGKVPFVVDRWLLMIKNCLIESCPPCTHRLMLLDQNTGYPDLSISWFFQCLSANVGIVCQWQFNLFLLNPFQFIIDQSSHHSMLCSLGTFRQLRGPQKSKVKNNVVVILKLVVCILLRLLGQVQGFRVALDGNVVVLKYLVTMPGRLESGGTAWSHTRNRMQTPKGTAVLILFIE
jgi:hypothetical protein